LRLKKYLYKEDKSPHNEGRDLQMYKEDHMSGVAPVSGGSQPIGDSSGQHTAAKVAYNVAQELENMQISQPPTNAQLAQIQALENQLNQALANMKHPGPGTTDLQLRSLLMACSTYVSDPSSDAWKNLLGVCNNITG
jgi:hypothetical protein